MSDNKRLFLLILIMITLCMVVFGFTIHLLYETAFTEIRAPYVKAAFIAIGVLLSFFVSGGTALFLKFGNPMMKRLNEQSIELVKTNEQFQQDLEERKKTERELRESEAKYRNLFENMTEEVHFWQLVRDETGRISTWRLVDANPPTLKTWGRNTAEEIVGKTTDEIFGPGATEHYMPVVQKIMTEGVPYSFEDYFPHLKKYFRFTSVPLGEYFITTGADITDIKKTDEALVASERKYRELIETANSIIIRWDKQGIIRFVNEYGHRFFGYSAGELIDREVMTIVPKVERSSGRDLDALVRNILIHPEDNTYVPNENITKDGRTVWVAWTNKAIVDAQGEVQEILAIGNDITALKETEKALRESEERFRLALRNAPVSVAAQDRDLRYIWAYNQKTSRPDQIIGHFDHEIFTAEEAMHFRAVKRRVLEEGSELQEQMWLNRPTGRIFLDISFAPFRNEGGRIIGVVSSTVDMTAIKLTEEAFRESDERLKRSQEIAHLGSWELDIVENKLIWSEEVYRIFGQAPRAFGATYAAFLERVHPDDRAAVDAAYSNSIREGQDSYEIEHRVVRKDTGEVRAVHERCEHLRDAAGNIVRSVGMVHDITEQKQAEEQIKAALKEKEVLLKEIHHRVKNNMQVISSLVSLQADESEDAVIHDILRDVTHRVRSMALVHEKLYESADLARIDFGEYVQSLVNYLWRSHGGEASGRRITTDLEPIALPVNEAVPCGLILNELISNALKHAFHGRADGEVAVSLGKDTQGRVTLCVRDNGRGFPAEFDWPNAKSLGLRLVQMLSEQLHAAVEVSSAGGAEFKLILRRADT